MASNPSQAIEKPPRPHRSQLQRACDNFEATAGGRDALVDHLAHARLSKEQEILVGAIADPRNTDRSLAKICQAHGVQFSSLMKLFQDAGFAKAQLAAMQRVWDKMPPLAEDVMTRALPHYIQCSVCAGDGKITKQRMVKVEGGKKEPEKYQEDCEGCKGKGQVLVQPLPNQQRLALEMSGLISTQGGAVVNVNQNNRTNVMQVAGGAEAMFAKFMSSSDEVLYEGVGQAQAVAEEEQPEAVDAEVVEPAQPTEPEPAATDDMDAEEFAEHVGETLGEEP